VPADHLLLYTQPGSYALAYFPQEGNICHGTTVFFIFFSSFSCSVYFSPAVEAAATAPSPLEAHQAAAQIQEIKGGATATLDISLQKPASTTTGTLKGRVVDGSNTGIAGVTVSYGGRGKPAGRGAAATDSNGFFSFAEVPAGDYRVQAGKEGYVGNYADVTVTAGEEANTTIVLQAVPAPTPTPSPAASPTPSPAPGGGGGGSQPPPVPQDKIFFASTRDGNYEIYVMDKDGGNQQRLTNNPSFDCYPACSPDRTKIAFSSERDGNREIYLMNSDGTGVQRLTTLPATSDSYPAWSPDGTKIAFSSFFGGGNFEIQVINVDGTGLTRLTNNTFDDSHPSWSPDGSKIAFHSNRVDSYEIYTMNSDGSNVARLTNDLLPDFEPEWAPDGTRIAFGKNYQIYSMKSSDGSDLVRLTNSAFLDYHPAWSCDNSALVFHSERAGNIDIYWISSDASNEQRLTYIPGEDTYPSYYPSASAYITSITPLAGSPGQVITINGYRFGALQGASKVTFGSTLATITSWSSTRKNRGQLTGFLGESVAESALTELSLHFLCFLLYTLEESLNTKTGCPMLQILHIQDAILNFIHSECISKLFFAPPGKLRPSQFGKNRVFGSGHNHLESLKLFRDSTGKTRAVKRFIRENPEINFVSGGHTDEVEHNLPSYCIKDSLFIKIEITWRKGCHELRNAGGLHGDDNIHIMSRAGLTLQA